jgi:RNA polymerase sigma factor (sigma-70 family)
MGESMAFAHRSYDLGPNSSLMTEKSLFVVKQTENQSNIYMETCTYKISLLDLWTSFPTLVNQLLMPFLKATSSEQEMLHGCLRNERGAQQLLHQRYCAALHAVARAYTKQEEDVLEIVQDSFLKIFQHLGDFDARQSSLYTWMRTIVVHTTIDHLRKGKKAPASVKWTEIHDSAIEAGVMQQMTAQQILQWLDTLSDTTRVVFTLFVTEGYSHKEIAEALGISEGTSRWHLSEARKHIIHSMKKVERA